MFFLLFGPKKIEKLKNYYSIGEKLSFPTPHSGQTKLSGRFMKSIPGAIPNSGTPIEGS